MESENKFIPKEYQSDEIPESEAMPKESKESMYDDEENAEPVGFTKEELEAANEGGDPLTGEGMNDSESEAA